MIKTGLLGAHGRMGNWVERLIASEFSARTSLVSQVSRNDRLEGLLDADVVIDFSTPSAMEALCHLCLKSTETLPCIVVGSTGWTSEGLKILENLSRKTLVLMASNFSIGVFTLSEILKEFSPTLEKLGYQPVLVESHHRHKKDAPSGTALSLERSMTSPDSKNPVQIHSIRAGETIGDHEVTFYGPGDQIVLGHFAQDRSIFARGAIDAALWLAQQRKTGIDPKHILGIEQYFHSLKENK